MNSWAYVFIELVRSAEWKINNQHDFVDLGKMYILFSFSVPNTRGYTDGSRNS